MCLLKLPWKLRKTPGADTAPVRRLHLMRSSALLKALVLSLFHAKCLWSFVRLHLPEQQGNTRKRFLKQSAPAAKARVSLLGKVENWTNGSHAMAAKTGSTSIALGLRKPSKYETWTSISALPASPLMVKRRTSGRVLERIPALTMPNCKRVFSKPARTATNTTTSNPSRTAHLHSTQRLSRVCDRN